MTSSSAMHQIAAVVAAAGRSLRMGVPKQLLPWQGTTMLRAAVDHLRQAGAEPVVVVLGHDADSMRGTLDDAALQRGEVQIALNPEYLTGEMLSSHQAGLRHLLNMPATNATLCGALLALGDQPHIPVSAIRAVMECAMVAPHAIAMPSYQMRRGHPIYLPAGLWEDALALGHSDTLRTLIAHHEDIIRYVEVDTPAVLRDIDTPDDYAALHPR